MAGPPRNLFDDVPGGLSEEQFIELVATPHARIERIVSNGQASPRGSWYDQDEAEWVLLLRGEAGLQFEDETAPRVLKPGDHVLIAAHRRHRVAHTAPGEPTIWLAVFFREG